MNIYIYIYMHKYIYINITLSYKKCYCRVSAESSNQPDMSLNPMK